MPVAFGFHPYLSCPLTSGGRRETVQVEMPYCTEITQASGDWAAYNASPFEGGELSIDQDFSGTRYFTQFAYHFMRLIDGEAGLATKVEWHSGFPRQYTALWAPDQQSPYFCIEPWSNLPNSFARPHELAQIAPGQSIASELILSIEEI